MAINFDKFSHTGRQFILELQREMDAVDEGQAGRVLKAVLHTLRESLLPQESLDLVSQLPMYIKAIYVDGWKIAESPVRIHNTREFIDKVVGYDPSPNAYIRDFGESADEQVETVKAVFRVLKRHVSEGQYEHVEAELPKAVKRLMREAELGEGTA